MLTALGVVWLAVLPMELDTPLHNPGMGWAIIDHATPQEIDAGRSAAWCKDGTVFEWYENAAVLSTWALVESRPGAYDWSLLDRAIDYWAATGKRIQLRFATDDFGTIPACPRWIFDRGVPSWDRQGQRFPDYTHPVYQDHLKRFLTVFADRYFDDPRIETVDLRGYGNWGEWHSGFEYPSVEEREKALRAIVDTWRAANRGRKPLMLSASYEWESYANAGKALLPLGTSIYDEFRPSYPDYRTRSVFDYALRFPDIALRRDGVGGAVFQEYDGRLIANFFQHYRKPIFTEFFGGPQAYRSPSVVGFGNAKAGDDFVLNAIDEAISHHANFCSPMGWGGRAAADFYNHDRAWMLYGQRWMGYRLVLVEAQYPAQIAPGTDWTLRHFWENHAMGRCYQPYRLAVFLMKQDKVIWQGVDVAFDPANFVSGEQYALESHFKSPDTLAPGEYELRLALVDVTGTPAIHLAIAGDDGQKRYRLGKMNVTSETPVIPPAQAIPQPKPAGARWTWPETLSANTPYRVSFRYRITTDSPRDLDTDDPGYFRGFAESAEHRRVGEARWFDKAGQPPAWKTFLIHTEGGTYRLMWEAVGGGAMTIDAVRVERLDPGRVRRVAIESGDIQLGEGASRYLQVRVRATRAPSQVRLPDDWYPYCWTHPDRIPLEPNRAYTVWFSAAVRPQIKQGDYPYLTLKSDKDTQAGKRAFYRWTQRHTANPVRHAYTFRTGPADDYRLVWGLKNGGEIEIAHLFIESR